jgi:hypothetical protein
MFRGTQHDVFLEFHVSEQRVLCVRKEGFVCQERGFRVSGKRVLCVKKEGFVCQKTGFRVSKSPSLPPKKEDFLVFNFDFSDGVKIVSVKKGN